MHWVATLWLAEELLSNVRTNDKIKKKKTALNKLFSHNAANSKSSSKLNSERFICWRKVMLGVPEEPEHNTPEAFSRECEEGLRRTFSPALSKTRLSALVSVSAGGLRLSTLHSNTFKRQCRNQTWKKNEKWKILQHGQNSARGS